MAPYGRPRRGWRWVRVVLTALLGATAGTATFALTVGAPVLAGHYACERGDLLATQFNWTPVVNLNSPFGGWGNLTYGVGSTGGGGGAIFNGSAAAVIGGGEWDLYEVDHVHLPGLGPDPSCAPVEAQFVPSIPTDVPFDGCACPTLAAGALSDAREPTQLTYYGADGTIAFTSVIFHNSFVADNAGNVSTCGGAGKRLDLTSTNLTFQVPFSTPVGTFILNESVYSIFNPTVPYGQYAAMFQYWFPPDFGTWAVDNLSAVGGPGGGFAFAFLGACS